MHIKCIWIVTLAWWLAMWERGAGIEVSREEGKEGRKRGRKGKQTSPGIMIFQDCFSSLQERLKQTNWTTHTHTHIHAKKQPSRNVKILGIDLCSFPWALPPFSPKVVPHSRSSIDSTDLHKTWRGERELSLPKCSFLTLPHQKAFPSKPIYIHPLGSNWIFSFI